MIKTAFKFLKYDKPKSIGVVFAIVVSTFLIGQQVGILNFLMSLMGGIINNSDLEKAQILVVDKITINANELGQIDERLVRELRSIDGVERTYPVVLSAASATFETGKSVPVLLIGSDAPDFVAGPTKKKIFKGTLDDLITDFAVSAEFFDSKTFNHPTDVGTQLEINGKRAFIRVQTKDARGFGGSYLFTTIDRARYYGNFPENKVSAIAVSVKKGYAINSVRDNINRDFEKVRAWKSEDLRASTVKFIVASSNIGTSIGSLVIFAIISGFFIIGLTLYSSAIDRIRDYGTLKAIGATNSYITKLILIQSFMFAFLGFVIALFLLIGFRQGVSKAGLIFTISPVVLGGLFLITLLISVGSSFFFSIRTLNKVEPASVFRG